MIWRYSLLFAILSITCPNMSAQGTITGLITDSSGNPIPHATVYIQELQHGTTANARGDYEIRVQDGTYTVFYQSLGYNQDFRQISVAGEKAVRDVSLTIQYFQIPEVIISSGREDPAYAIMRKTIARAPYYLNAVEHYRALVYLKGTAVINKIPRIMRKAMTVNEEQIKIGEIYLYESHNEITFDAPDKYLHRLIAIQSTFPSESDQVSPMNYIQASFYEPVIADIAISPLAPNAFSHYRFSYEGASLQGQYIINKIRVTPKRKSQQLFSGTIYIIDELWCIHSLDLENDNLAGNIRVRQLYTPVQDDLWMPVSHKFDVDFAMLGIKGEATYGSSVKYSEISTNISIDEIVAVTPVPMPEVTEKVEITQSKSERELEELLSKEELSNREMIKLSKLLEKKNEQSQTDESDKRDLEIKPKTEFMIEPDAAKRSADFWSEIRPIPLADNELISISSTDSLKNRLREVKTGSNEIAMTISSEKGSPFLKALQPVLTGKTWRADSNSISLNFGGLIKLSNFSFNSVDGFKYDLDFRFTRRWKDGISLTISPETGYAFSRESFYWTVNSTLNYSKKNSDYFWFRAGDRTADFSDYGTANSLINSFYSLFLKENLTKFYHSKYLSAGHRSELTNGLYLEVSARAEDRRVLTNNTEFSFLKRDQQYLPNQPVNKLIDNALFPAFKPYNHLHYEIKGMMTIIPFQRYRISEGRKIAAGSDYPTVNLSYAMGINKSGGERSLLNKITASVSKSKNTGPMAEIYWRVRGGAVISNDSIPFQDFIHFNTQPSPLLLNDYRDAFYLPGWYSLSTDKWFIEGHMKYTNPYILLKYLPGMSETLMRENLHIRYLFSNQTNHYIEAGYSISEIFLLGEAGIFTGFENFKFKSAGFRFILKFN